MAATAFVGAAAPVSAGPAPAQIRAALRGAGVPAAQAPEVEVPSAWSRAGLGGAAAAAALAGCKRQAKQRTRAARRAEWMTLEKPKESLNPDKFKDVCEQTGVTLSRYMIELSKRGVVDGDLNSIMNSISEGTKVIANLIRKAPLQQAELLGLQGEVNVQGEDQKKLDVITNEVLKNALRYTGKLGTLASEEEDNPVGVDAEDELNDEFDAKIVGDSGSYVAVFDPLDGSSNVDAGVPVGTIFGVFKEPLDADCDLNMDGGELDEDQQACLTATLQPGRNLVCAGYVFYSASTEFVVTFGQGVVGFTLDQDICDYKLTRPSVKIPARGKIYSVNQANESQWDEPMRQWINDLQEGKGESGVKYTQRYIGSMVGDVHRTLLYGGVFAYPADEKNKDGKLRLLYEAAPMSFLMEQAGGKSITGHSRVMDIPPTNVHQRVPIIMGSPDDIDECYSYYNRSSDPKLIARCEARLKGTSA